MLGNSPEVRPYSRQEGPRDMLLRVFDRFAFGVIAALALALIAVLSGIVDAGPLDPTDPPGPTMKTLQEVEPRTPISSLPFAATEPGSYYLTRNLAGSGFNSGITVSSDDVVIDLNGFTLTGGSTAGGVGILTLTPLKNITVRNGTLRAWNAGISLPGVTGAVVEDITVAGMGGFGISLGTNGTVRNCTGRDNATETVKTGTYGNVSGCNVGDSTGAQTGIAVGASSIVSNSVVENNGAGISAGSGSIVRDNVVKGSGFSGITVGGESLVTGNVSTGNGTAGEGSGIAATGVANTIRDNIVTLNDNGIFTGTGSNVVIGNTAFLNGAEGIANEYVIQPTNVAGPALDGVSVDAATNPYANFAP